MKTLKALTRKITGKELVQVGTFGWFHQDETTIEIPKGSGKKEAVVHEVCHWVIAHPWQRVHPHNLGYGSSSDDYRGRDLRCSMAEQEIQERLTCQLQFMLYQMAGLEPPVSPSCNAKRMKVPLNENQIQHIIRSASEVGWSDLMDLVRARR